MQKKRGQITVFMILGIVVLVIFVVVMSLSSGIKKAQLQEQKEGVISQLFTRESLRIFVEDCLQDRLVTGLQLMARQGAIWQHQGGTKVFTEDRGIQVGDDQVAFALTFSDEVPLYPCQEEGCEYTYPDQGFFGKRNLYLTSIERDLEHYLLQETELCVQETVQEKISTAAEFGEDDISLDISVIEGGITVMAHYPLKFVVGGEEFFQLSDFDFFYPTQFKEVYDTAIVQPVTWDWQYVDFPFTHATLAGETFAYGHQFDVAGETCTDEGEYFLCNKQTKSTQYNLLGMNLLAEPLHDGVTLFTISPVWDEQIPFFQVARQNRPPALSHVSRCPAEGYDYLVVNGVEHLETIEFTPRADDPDDDLTLEVEITVEDGSGVRTPDSTGLYSFEASGDFTVTASDGVVQDWQDVRVQIDEKAEPQIEFINLVDTTNTALLPSLEDPVCVTVVVPPEIDSYTFTLGGEFTFPEGVTGLPGEAACTDEGDILTIKDELDPYFDVGTNFYQSGGTVSYSDDPECQYTVDEPEPQVVTACTPFSNSEYPYPYMTEPVLNELYKYDTNGERDDTRTNPFKASNTCCSATGERLGVTQTCVDTEGCFTNRYYVEKLTRQCSGNRGNMCDGVETREPKTAGINTCGNPNKPFCDEDIHASCANQQAYALISNQGWCSGTYGCEELCTEEVVQKELGALIFNPTEDWAQFDCGCSSTTINHVCDKSHLGTFSGTCKSSFSGVTCVE